MFYGSKACAVKWTATTTDNNNISKLSRFTPERCLFSPMFHPKKTPKTFHHFTKIHQKLTQSCFSNRNPVSTGCWFWEDLEPYNKDTKDGRKPGKVMTFDAASGADLGVFLVLLGRKDCGGTGLCVYPNGTTISAKFNDVFPERNTNLGTGWGNLGGTLVLLDYKNQWMFWHTNIDHFRIHGIEIWQEVSGFFPWISMQKLNQRPRNQGNFPIENRILNSWRLPSKFWWDEVPLEKWIYF